MNPLDQLAETRIQEAQARGELDHLPGAGQPLQLDDDSFVPPTLRVAYRILKNAGFLPPELQLRKDIAEAEALLLHSADHDAATYARARAKLLLLRERLNHSRKSGNALALEEAYFQKLLERLNGIR